MSPIQQMFLGVGAVATKTYVDDVFSTYLWEATNANRSINLGFDYTSDEGLVWIKNRGGTDPHVWFDTVRGANKRLSSNLNAAENTSITNELKSFTSTGYNLGDAGTVNGNDTFSSWNFKSAPGFFDVVTYSGDGTDNRSISHSLGCSVGMMIIKVTNHADDWLVWHKDLEDEKALTLNTTNEALGYSSSIPSDPTSSSFTVSSNVKANASGKTYVCYLFAGGESTAATARSVVFDGSGDYLSIADSSDFEIDGTNFTLECWFKADDLSGGQAIAGQWQSGGGTQRNFDFYLSGSTLYFENCRGSTNYSISTTVSVGQWYHIAGVLDGTTLKLFVNGNLVGTTTVSGSANNSTANFGIGGYATGTAEEFNGKISNVRFVKGTAVYTSSFRPPTEPLTNITNTKLLCCNNSSTTGSTVTPGTITANGDPTASTDSPFDDPAGFVFGDAGDQNVIKCGSYVGNGSTDGPEINLGWEPQWVMIKNTSTAKDWKLFDSMRGITSNGVDQDFQPNTNDAESSGAFLDLTATGWKLTSGSSRTNTDGDTYIFLAIRRSDGYVGKPPELGTDVFAMDTGNSSSTIPNFDSGFPVDFQINRQPATSQSWYTGSRLTSKKYLLTDTNAAEGEAAVYTYDSNTGWCNHNYNSDYQSWMWKRHAGFDVVTYTGNGTAGRQISHSLAQTPEMIWVKCSSANGWAVGHKGLNGGTNPWQYNLKLNEDAAEENYTNRWNDTAPNSTVFTVGTSNRVNLSGDGYRAMLFSSISGISKVGSYTGNGSTTGTSVTTGFTVRFLIIKSTSSDSWMVIDTLREFTSTDSKYLQINTTGAQEDITLVKQITNGFQLSSTFSGVNSSGQSYIYYAHS